MPWYTLAVLLQGLVWWAAYGLTALAGSLYRSGQYGIVHAIALFIGWLVFNLLLNLFMPFATIYAVNIVLHALVAFFQWRFIPRQLRRLCQNAYHCLLICRDDSCIITYVQFQFICPTERIMLRWLSI